MKTATIYKPTGIPRYGVFATHNYSWWVLSKPFKRATLVCVFVDIEKQTSTVYAEYPNVPVHESKKVYAFEVLLEMGYVIDNDFFGGVKVVNPTPRFPPILKNLNPFSPCFITTLIQKEPIFA